jgi:hypothetical protein
MAKKCQFRKTNGEGCDADAQSGKTVCVFHDPATATDGQRARRTGGLSLEQGPMEERLTKLESILMKNIDASELFDFKSINGESRRSRSTLLLLNLCCCG